MRSRRLRHIAATFAITFGVTALLWLFLFGNRWIPSLQPVTSAFARAEYAACDLLLFGLRGSLAVPEKIIVVAADADSMAQLHHDWPYPRDWHAVLVDRMKAWGAKVIAFDVVFGQANGDQADRDLVAACKEAGNVVLAADLGSQESSAGTAKRIFDGAFPELREVTATGLVTTKYEGDAQNREVRRGAASDEIAGTVIPSLPVMAVSKKLGVKPQIEPFASLTVGATVLPLDDDNSFWINFVGPPARFRTFSYYQVVDDDDRGRPQVPTDAFKDAIVFVGVTDPLEHDDAATPYGPGYPGVLIHANVANMLLNNVPLYRWPFWTAVLLGGIMALAVSTASVAGRPTFAGVCLAAGATLYCIVAYRLFVTQHLWIPVAVPLTGGGVAYVAGVVYRYLTEERERKRVSSLFSKYVSKDVAQELMDDENASELGNSRKLPVTCLFSDIRGFTSMSEKLTPEEVVALLNEYFDKMVQVVFDHRGTLDKYVGDAIMATFGVPKSLGNDAESACRVAVRMREELTKLQEKWASEGKAGLDIGIGVNSGDAVVGNIGHYERKEYTCIGDTINTASRLESLNKEVGTKVLISESTYNLVKDLGLFEVRELPPQHVKGKEEAIQVYELLGWKGAPVPERAPVAAAAH